MKKRVEITNSPEETQRLAGDLIKELLLDSRLCGNDIKRRMDSCLRGQGTKGRGNDMEGAKKNKKKAIVIGLEGELGSGKTAFIQGMAKELGIKEIVTSPTFVIFKKYSVGRSPSAVRCFYHFDCYRLDSAKDILDLGFREIVGRPENLVAIEWSEKIKKILPKNCLTIKFSHLGADKRKIEMPGFSGQARAGHKEIKE